MAGTAAAGAGHATMAGEAALTPPAEADDGELAPGDGSAAGSYSDTYLFDTSSYMFGSAAVDVIFMESDGSEESQSETWSSSQKTKALNEIRTGLDFWEGEAPGRLSFEISSRTLDTGVEPIEHPGPTGSECDNQWRWIQDAMDQLGYTDTTLECDETFSGSTYVAVYERNHDLRNAKGTDWATTIFLVDSQNDGDGRFADDFFAYAYLNGPFMIMTWDNNGWGPDNMDRVGAHEMGHIFGATDEYNGEAETWGYLWAQDDDGSSCLMDDNDYCLSTGSKHQVGWRDSDGDGTPDPLDTQPDVDALGFAGPPAQTSDATLDFSGEARDDPYPAAPEFRAYGFHNVSVNDVNDVTWTTSAGSSSTSVDDADPRRAPWDFATETLADGEHQVSVSAENQVGASDPDPVTRTVTVDTTPPAVQLHDPAPGRVYVAGTTSHENPQDPEGDDPPLVTGSVIYLNATASDALTGLQVVDFYIDGELVERSHEPPHQSQEFLSPFGDGAPGEHVVTAVARDKVDNAAPVSQAYVVPPSSP